MTKVCSRPTRLDDRGAAAVEFALIMPMLFLLIFGIIDFGRMWNMQLSLSHAAREGVRVAALTGDNGAAVSRALSTAQPINGVTAAVTTACPSPMPTTGNFRAVVTASRTYNYITPISGVLGVMGFPALATPTVTGRGEMRCGG